MVLVWGLAACAGQTVSTHSESSVSQYVNPIRAVTPSSGTIFRQGEPIPIRYDIDSSQTVDSVILRIDGCRIGVVGSGGDTIQTTEQTPVGTCSYVLVAYIHGAEYPKGVALSIRPARAPKRLDFSIRQSFPHSANSYTQGLFWHGGMLYEGTGLYGRSALMQVELANGKPLKQIDLDDNLFGEGIALLDHRIYQLTWQNGICLVYDVESLGQTGSFKYSGEGWGITTDGQWLYMSDGSNRIAVRDPETFEIRRTIQVYDSDGAVNQLNELEWIDGAIWANVYLTNRIVVIDPATGAVTADLDLTSLTERIDRTPTTDVLNGIAYDPQSERIFVTGKNWNKLFEILPDFH